MCSCKALEEKGGEVLLMHASRDRGREREKEKRAPFDIGDDTEYACIASIFSFFLMFSFSLFECVRDVKEGMGEMGEPGGLNVVPGFSCYLAASAAKGRNMDVSPGGHG